MVQIIMEQTFIIQKWSSCRCPMKIRPFPTESALQLPNTFKNQECYALSFFHSYLLTCYVMWGYFSWLISDAKSIMNFPSKTQSFNNKFIFILHNNKWVWMKEHNFIHSLHCHVEFHCKLSDKTVNKRDHSENY